jgi:hypothetical protein
MQLLSIFLVTLLSCFQNFDSHHVVFEEIGKMAGALSYIHAMIPVNISGLVKTAHRVQRDIDTVEAAYQKLHKMEANQNSRGKIEAWLMVVRLDLDGLVSTINDLKNTLPRVDSTTTASSTDYRVR